METLINYFTLKVYSTVTVCFSGLVSEFALKQNLFFVIRRFYSERNLNDYRQVL